jgi:ribosome-interacting GTPase 1
MLTFEYKEKIEYFSDFKKIMGVLERIADIEAEMERTQRNKATARHLGLLKAQLAKLRRELIDPKGSGGGGKGEGFDVAKTGDARIGFVGFPSVGKVRLIFIFVKRKNHLHYYLEYIINQSSWCLQ